MKRISHKSFQPATLAGHYEIAPEMHRHFSVLPSGAPTAGAQSSQRRAFALSANDG
jgi:hypothetical protein